MTAPQATPELPAEVAGQSLRAVTGYVAAVNRRTRVRAIALELLNVAGYVPKARLRQAMKIAWRCEPQDEPHTSALCEGAKGNDEKH